MLDTVSSVLSRTSTLLPGSLFTSLASTRTEHLADAKRVRSFRFTIHYYDTYTLYFSFL